MATSPDNAYEKSSGHESDEFLRLRTARDSAVKAAREAVRDTTRLTRLLAILNERGSLEHLLERVLSTLSELFLADIVVLLDPNGTGSFSPLAAIGIPEDNLHLPFSDKEGGFVHTLLRSGSPVLLDTTANNPAIDTQLADIGVKEIVGLPVKDSNETRGALILARCRPDPFSDADVSLLLTMAYRIGQTILEAHQSSQFEKIVQSGREINRHLDLTTVGSEVVRTFPEIVSADASALVLSDQNGKFYCASQTGLKPSCCTALNEFAEYLAVSSRFLEEEYFTASNVGATLEHLPLGPLDLSPVKAVLAIPLHRKNFINGIVFGLRFSAIAFTSSTLQVATVFAEQISFAIENSRLYQAVHNELTERKKLEEERKKWEWQQQQLQKAESLNRMAGAIAHHFNNMLFAVVGNIQLALLDLPPGSSVACLDQALKASNRAAEVSSLMLTYLGHSVAAQEALGLSDICRNCLSDLKAEVNENIALKVDIPSPGPTIKANANQIQQVLRNLIQNACESITEHEGCVHVRISTASQQEIPVSHRFPVDWEPNGDRFACVEIQDSGSGILEKEMDKIFDPFFSTKFTGRGLGLPVTLGIVRAHQGLMTVESRQVQGSVFKVFFPLLSDYNQQPPSQVVEHAELRPTATVLIVDDEDMVRRMTVSMLNRMGYKVIEAKDGAEAVEKYRQNKNSICVVLCDLTMPDMDGWQTLEALGKIEPEIPLILVSGYSESHVMQGDHSSFPQAFLHKPYHFSDLQQTLALVLSSSVSRARSLGVSQEAVKYTGDDEETAC